MKQELKAIEINFKVMIIYVIAQFLCVVMLLTKLYYVRTVA